MPTLTPSLRTEHESVTHAGPDQVIRAAGLPDAIGVMIAALIRRTRLRRAEKTELARELCAHFADGLRAGTPAEVLLRDFGDPAAAARLIAIAVKRKRSWPHRALRRALQACAASAGIILLSYLWLAARYHLRAPTITRNYAAEYNAPFLALPESQCAWPVYRDLMARWRFPKGERAHEIPVSDPSSPLWSATRAALADNADALVLLRAAAARPHLGAVLAPDENADVASFLRRSDPARASQTFAPPLPDPRNPALIATLIPELSVARFYCRALIADMAAAVEDRDPARFNADARAAFGIAHQLRDQRLLIGDLIALALISSTEQTIARGLDASPDLWSEAQLVELAHMLAAVDAFGVSLEGERLAFADVLQRTFSDDGTGDGSLLASGLELLAAIQQNTPGALNQHATLDALAGPAASGIIASRRTLLEMFNRSIDRAERIAAMPLWTRTDQDNADLDVIRLFVTGSTFSQLRYLPLKLFLPALGHASIQAEYAQQIHDAVTLAVAIEIHHKRAHAYPDSLDQLVPALLPAIPPDRYTGKPIRYALRNSKPLLYSVGVDRTDNQGMPPKGEQGNLLAQTYRSPAAAQGLLRNLEAIPDTTPDIRGDWILFPPPN